MLAALALLLLMQVDPADADAVTPPAPPAEETAPPPQTTTPKNDPADLEPEKEPEKETAKEPKPEKDRHVHDPADDAQPAVSEQGPTQKPTTPAEIAPDARSSSGSEFLDNPIAIGGATCATGCIGGCAPLLFYAVCPPVTVLSPCLSCAAPIATAAALEGRAGGDALITGVGAAGGVAVALTVSAVGGAAMWALYSQQVVSSCDITCVAAGFLGGGIIGGIVLAPIGGGIGATIAANMQRGSQGSDDKVIEADLALPAREGKAVVARAEQR